MSDHKRPQIVRTERTPHVSIEEAPEEFRPYADMTDFENITYSTISDSEHMVMYGLVNSGSEALVVDGVDKSQDLLASYNAYLDENKGQLTASESLAKEAKDKYWKDRDKYLEKGIAWGPDQEAEFVARYVKDKKASQENKLYHNAVYNAFSSTFETSDDNAAANIANYKAKNAYKKLLAEAQFNAMAKDMFDFLNGVSFEYLTRGAMMWCTGGKICRHLNLLFDHGVFYGETQSPVVNFSDSRVGIYGNITSFGLCEGLNPPAEKVRVKDLTSVNTDGGFMSAVEDRSEVGSLCKPLVVAPGWFNPYEETKMSVVKAVSTKSFLICAHGGFIYPLSSGQHDNLMNVTDPGPVMDEISLMSGVYNQMLSARPALEEENKSREPGQPDKLAAHDKELGYVQKRMDKALDDYMSRIFNGSYDKIPTDNLAALDKMLSQYDETFGTNRGTVSHWDLYNQYHFQHGYNSQSTAGGTVTPAYPYYLADGETVEQVERGWVGLYGTYNSLVQAGNDINSTPMAPDFPGKINNMEENKEAKAHILEQLKNYMDSYYERLVIHGSPDEWKLYRDMEDHYNSITGR